MKLNQILLNQHQYFSSNITKDLSFRKNQLQRLYCALKENEPSIYRALYHDLNKSEYETYLAELSIVYSEINSALKHLSSWSKPQKKKTPLSHFPAKSFTLKEPYGVVLVLSPWNYPLQLAIAPLVGAIAAGNCVVLKASKSSGATTDIIYKIISETFEEQYIYCVDSTIDYEEILKQEYDYIFFTGSERVGKIVMHAASEHVTPLSLELGGKSPCIVDKDANLDIAAKRIIWGKLLNAGQTCVAPDYVFVHKDCKDILISKMKIQISNMYGNPLSNPDYPKIINPHHFKRLTALIDQEPNKTNSQYDYEQQKIFPTLFTDASFESEIMQEEIFGPILPILTYEDENTVVTQIKAHAKPLACYLFSENKQFISKMLSELSFGGGCINDTVMHIANHHLPFGGVGSSGMGHYHSHYSFDTFSHEKSIVKTSTKLDIPLRYAPYKKSNLTLIKWILK